MLRRVAQQRAWCTVTSIVPTNRTIVPLNTHRSSTLSTQHCVHPAIHRCNSTSSPSSSASSPVYVTTPIFYVNGRPHIGHAYTSVLADALTRTLRLTHDGGAHLMTGTDEHGNKVEDAARAAGHNNTIEFCDTISSSFRNVFDRMNIQYDQYLRTTQPAHSEAVTAMWQRLYDAGYIYLGKHEGWYCKADEAFVPENQVSPKEGEPNKHVGYDNMTYGTTNHYYRCLSIATINRFKL
jgi:leucyl-tRNA synthetase